MQQQFHSVGLVLDFQYYSQSTRKKRLQILVSSLSVGKIVQLSQVCDTYSKLLLSGTILFTKKNKISSIFLNKTLAKSYQRKNIRKTSLLHPIHSTRTFSLFGFSYLGDEHLHNFSLIISTTKDLSNVLLSKYYSSLTVTYFLS